MTKSQEDYYICRQCNTKYEFSPAWSLLAVSPLTRATFALFIFISIAFGLASLVVSSIPLTCSPSSHPPSSNHIASWPACIFRNTIDIFVWGRSVNDDQWRKLFTVSGRVTRPVVIARGFLIGLGLIGLLQALLIWPQYVLLVCVGAYVMYHDREYPQKGQDSARIVLTSFIVGGIGKSIVDLSKYVRALALMMRRRALSNVVDRGTATNPIQR